MAKYRYSQMLTDGSYEVHYYLDSGEDAVVVVAGTDNNPLTIEAIGIGLEKRLNTDNRVRPVEADN